MPYLAPHAVPGSPAVLRVPNMGKAKTLTENWHFDAAYFENPPPIAILAAQVLPPVGGDTMWANQYAAYEALSPAMQRLLSGLRAAFTGSMPDDDGVRREVVTYHPVVRTHPATKRQALGIGRIESVPYFEGMTEEESRGLLEFLYQPRLAARVRVPPPMARRRCGHVGQPMPAALCDPRPRRRRASDAPGHRDRSPRRTIGMTETRTALVGATLIDGRGGPPLVDRSSRSAASASRRSATGSRSTIDAGRDGDRSSPASSCCPD